MKAVEAGAAAVRIMGSAQTLFEAGGQRLLSESSRGSLRDGLTRAAETGLQELGGETLTRSVQASLKGGSQVVLRESPQAAAREVLKGVGQAAGVGALIDGAFAACEAMYAYSEGSMSAEQAGTYVAIEAITGGAATAAGVGMAATAVVLTGGLAAPVVFGIGAVATIGAKMGLRSLFSQ